MSAATVCAVILISLQFLACEGALECYSCNNVSALMHCNNITVCPAGSRCYMDLVEEHGQKKYTLGCKQEAMCVHMVNPVGRAVASQAASPCSSCCNVNNCNRQLCQASDPGCQNTADYDCESVGSSINICEDTSHAKNTCRRFCGLCSMIDGGWSHWEAWSPCDVTCDEGSQSRSRSCSDPSPQGGGLDCTGAKYETQKCSLGRCPVWVSWTAWSTCSRTCDIGMQQRLRKCILPQHSINGQFCDGETNEQRLCFPGACADGAWGSWGAWDTCSRSCNQGLRSRSRACDSPSRSILGRDCPGNPSQTELCSVTLCNDTNVVFLARNIGAIPSINVVVFKTIEVNEGGGYNTTTGIFTAPVGGTYSFSSQLCPKTSAVVFQFVHNSKVMGGFFHGTEVGGGCVSMVSNAVLKAGDNVWVRSYYTGGDVFEDDNSIWNMFTGVLVRKSTI